MPQNYSIFSFSSSDLEALLGGSTQSSYLMRYLMDLDVKTCLSEERYIDKDYMIDYQKFYVRSFKHIERFTKRIHFFRGRFDENEFQEALENGDRDFINSMKESYLGFTVVKPLEVNRGKLIGRTLLKTYPEDVDDGYRRFIKKKYTASLFGIPLEIETLPFQVQDQGVSACATIALWTALHPLTDIFEIKRDSPAEITETATTSLPFSSRKFPSSGLTIEQMIGYIWSLGLDTEIIKIKKDENEEAIPIAVKAYINAGFPIIAGLKLEIGGKIYKHAAVISGYRCDREGNMKELYVHDDQIGPYSRVRPASEGFIYWDNEWIHEYGYDSVKLEQLIIPIYPKIRATFSRIYGYTFVKMKEEGLDVSNLALYLYSVNEYKKFLLDKNIENKLEKLTMSLPRYLWVLRLFENSQESRPLLDYIFDGTSVFPTIITEVNYY